MNRHLNIPKPTYMDDGSPITKGFGMFNPLATTIMKPLIDLGLIHAVLTSRVDYKYSSKRREGRHTFLLLLDGKMTIEFEDTVHKVQPGDMVFFTADTLVYQSNPGKSSYLYLTFKGNNPYWKPLIKTGPFVRPYESTDLMYLLMLRIESAIKNSSSIAYELAEKDGQMLADLLKHEVRLVTKKPLKNRKEMKELVQRIKQSPGDDWNLESMAKEVNVSTRTLLRTFSDEYGLSPVDMVVREKLTWACKLLNNSDLKVDAIAHKVGYQSVSSFIKLFKKNFGMTPGQRRALFRKEQKAHDAGN